MACCGRARAHRLPSSGLIVRPLSGLAEATGRAEAYLAGVTDRAQSPG